MKKQASPGLCLLLICLLLYAPFVAAQQTTPQPPPASSQSSSTATKSPQDSDDDVVRITTNLVQIDAVVTDKNGAQVTDLRPEEIEIFEDGRPQVITNFSYVSNETATGTDPLVASAAAPAAKSKADNLAPPVPPVRLRPEQVRRTVALVVDDLGASFESTHSIREALRKYVEQQMQPTDLVAIVRTSAGMGALQQFTSDRRQLNAAIERVRWKPLNGRISAFAPVESDPVALAKREAGIEGSFGDSMRDARAELDEFREQIFSVGTLGALNFVIRGMRELPGRKAIVLFSDGIEMLDRNGERNDRILEALRRLTDLANRASVVIYTIDARGMQYTGLTAADSTSGMSIRDIETVAQQRSQQLFESQSGLQYLAQQTGGFAIRNSNDLSRGVGRVLADQKGYYLIGYRPDESTFDAVKGRTRFHRIDGRVKRRGLRLRLRSGFYGFTEEDARPALRTRQEQFIAALSSPFASGGVRVRLTTLFNNSDREGSFVRSLLHMDARDLSFKPEPDGWQKAVIEVVAFTFGDNGQVINQISRVETIRARGRTYEHVLKNGLVYNFNVPVKKPGAYQLRIAVRDTDTERIGSASQFIEVPNLSKKRLTLSGIVLTTPAAESAAAGQTGAGAKSSTSAASVDARLGEGSDDNPQAGPALRLFRRGSMLDYFYYIYNAKLDRADGRPQIQTQVRLFREGQPVYTGKPTPLDMSQQPDVKYLMGGARLHLGTELPPGEYLLQVIVSDLLAGERHRTATQWIDFEIVK